MGKRFLIDTNVIIDYTSNLLPDQGIVFVEHIFSTDFITSVIVKIEALGYSEPLPEKMQLLAEFINHASILPLDDAITLKTIDLRKSKKIKLGDGIIAATALVHNLILISRNTADFINIEGLDIIDPHNM